MSEITKKEVETMIDNHAKSLELSNVKDELEKVKGENKDLITKLASEEVEKVVNEVVEKVDETTPQEELEELQEKVADAVAEGVEENGDVTELGAVLEKVAGLETRISDLAEVVEELSSRFKDVCSSIKVVTPLEAGVGQMTMSAEEFVVIDEDGKVWSKSEEGEAFLDTVDDEDGGYKRAVKFTESEAKEFVSNHDGEVKSVKDAFAFVEKSSEDKATDEEVEAAIAVLEEYVDKVGTLPEVVAKPEEEVVKEKTEEELKKEEISSLRERIKSRKPVTSSKRELILDRLRKKHSIETSSTKTVETSSTEETSDYEAGELAGKLFARKR